MASKATSVGALTLAVVVAGNRVKRHTNSSPGSEFLLCIEKDIFERPRTSKSSVGHTIDECGCSIMHSLSLGFGQ